MKRRLAVVISALQFLLVQVSCDLRGCNSPRPALAVSNREQGPPTRLQQKQRAPWPVRPNVLSLAELNAGGRPVFAWIEEAEVGNCYTIRGAVEFPAPDSWICSQPLLSRRARHGLSLPPPVPA